MKEVVAERDALQKELDELSSLMVRCKAGMVHICEKLEDVDAFVPEPVSTPGPLESTDVSMAKSHEEGVPERVRESDRGDQMMALIHLTAEKVKNLMESMKNYDYKEETRKIDETQVGLLSPYESNDFLYTKF